MGWTGQNTMACSFSPIGKEIEMSERSYIFTDSCVGGGRVILRAINFDSLPRYPSQTLYHLATN